MTKKQSQRDTRDKVNQRKTLISPSIKGILQSVINLDAPWYTASEAWRRGLWIWNAVMIQHAHVSASSQGKSHEQKHIIVKPNGKTIKNTAGSFAMLPWRPARLYSLIRWETPQHQWAFRRCSSKQDQVITTGSNSRQHNIWNCFYYDYTDTQLVEAPLSNSQSPNVPETWWLKRKQIWIIHFCKGNLF